MKKRYSASTQLFVTAPRSQAPMTAALQKLLRRFATEVKAIYKLFTRFLLTAAAFFMLAGQASAQTPVLTGTTIICTGTSTTITASGTAPFVHRGQLHYALPNHKYHLLGIVKWRNENSGKYRCADASHL